VEAFETYRPYLFSIAYRMLGSAMDAEDLVQETYLRYQSTPPETIRSLKAFLTIILTRLCVDHLQLARRKREVYMGPWLPEPILTTTTAASEDPAERVEREESISLAFLALLEELQPFERAVILLHEVFEYDFAEIATMLDKSEAACRRSFSRAKLHLRAHRPRFGASAETHRQLLSGYFQAIETGEMAPLMNLLADNVTPWADGGGKVKGAATRPLTGREAVARFSVGARQRFVPPAGSQVEMTVVNGEPALVIRVGAQAVLVLSIEVEHGRIRAIRIMANPEKLTRV
jgi:RNA polymerase sigma-70 factor, ECF subfamily